MEDKFPKRVSPDLKRYKDQPKPAVIRELQQEEDVASINSYRVENDATVGISVNEKLTEEVACDGQPMIYQLKRWKKLANDFSKDDGTFDISKIPEICDNIKFDLLHSPGELTNDMRLELLETAQQLCRIIVPMEYGVTLNDKIEIGLKIITPLLKKIQNDILWWK